MLGIAGLVIATSTWVKAESPAVETKAAPPPATVAPRPEPPSPQSTARTGVFETPWQEESQFIVQAVATDLAEMMFFAKSGRLPEAGTFAVEAGEKGVSPDGTLIYGVKVRFSPDSVVETELPLAPTIWSPACYQPLTRALMEKLALAKPVPAAAPSGDLIERLTDLRAPTIERANEEVSDQLVKDFSAPALHEEAALVLAAFALREHTGIFFELRRELCRMTAHLALANALRKDGNASLAGRLAEAAQVTLYNNRTDAMKLLETLPLEAPGVAAWQRALRTRNTGDFRIIHEEPETSRFERLERFDAEVRQLGVGLDTLDLPQADGTPPELTDWLRVVSGSIYPGDYSVETGHVLWERALDAELREISEVRGLGKDGPLTKGNFVTLLNAEPRGCLEIGPDGTPRVRVVSWGLWAAFLQRHLCHALVEDFYFLDHVMGLHASAIKFRQEIDPQFRGLRLFPFVRRQNATDEADYHLAQDDAMAVILRSPELVPAGVWNFVSFRFHHGATYVPGPSPHINDWHRANHNPPPGTAYDANARMNHPSLMNQPDTVAHLSRLHALAPWDHDITYFMLRQSYGGNVPAAQLIDGYHAVLDFDPDTDLKIAEASKDNPAMYLEWMGRAAELKPSNYYRIGKYLAGLHRDEEAATAFANGFSRDRDPVRVSNEAGWLVNYFETHGEPENATALANRAAEAYSEAGLETKAKLLEQRKDYDGALELHRAITERYGNSGSLLAFLGRAAKASPDPKFQTLLDQTLQKSVPSGLEKVELAQFSGAPADGVVFATENEETQKAGLRPGDVIVAVQGYRVHEFRSYTALRELEPTAPVRLILWRSGAYLELSATPPNHRFGVTVRTYKKGS